MCGLKKNSCSKSMMPRHLVAMDFRLVLSSAATQALSMLCTCMRRATKAVDALAKAMDA
jgi:hypothetical protein